jgi:hypothetical protein
MNPRDIGNRSLAPRIPSEFSALMTALQLQGAGTKALQELTDRQWSTLLEFTDLAHLTLSLSQVRREGFPHWVSERLDRNVADNAVRFERVKTTYKEAADVLDKAHVEYVVLKGFAQSPDYVKNPRLRMQSDLDLFCPLEEIERAKAALESIGYEPEKSLDYSRADHIPAFIRRDSWKWKGNAFDPEMPLSIELHFALWNEKLTLLSIPDVWLFWKRREFRMVEDVAFTSLSDGDHLAYLALHILRNLLAGDWVIHHVHELALFLHNQADDHEFWKCWKQTYSSKLRMLAAIAFFLAKSWFCGRLHSEVEAEIAGIPPQIGSWLQRFAGSSLEGMFRQNKDFVWLHTALLSSAKEKRQALSRAFIPKRIPGRSSPGIGLKLRRAKKVRMGNQYVQYASYIASRTATLTALIPRTLSRGLRLWLSQRQLGRQFWTFLGASFFLTWAFQSISSCSICS